MISVKGYTVTEKLYEDFKTIVYRATRQHDNRSVIFKILRTEYPTPREIARIKHEYEITRNLEVEGIVKPHGLEKYNGLSLVLEDFDGKSLKQFISSTKLNLLLFLRLAIQLTETLGKIHAQNIIHKDIKPLNIIFNPVTQQVKITDFSIASRLSRETQGINNPNLLEGTLAYMSPEQTGRMNRVIDYRTDLYSLGVSFYEMLTGRLPFLSNDPMEMVHCHIAKTPTPPHEVEPDIPKPLSDIVMKLLAKTAEERYQSAFGLTADLEYCLAQLQSSGKIPEFALAQRDVSAGFQIPQKLYGREAEITVLLNAFDRISQGTTELITVAGYSGIGKTALIQEVHKPIVRQKGYFIAGKCDQYKRNIPYASLIQAFQELVRQILTEDAEQIQLWREKLLDAFGINGQVIIDVIPDVELIVGQQPAVLPLGATETQNRFNFLFQKFIQVFARTEHPLVLFLDDLQWVDPASLKLLQLLVTESSSQSLLLISAYRDNEVSPTHPLMLVLDEIHKSRSIVNQMTLTALTLDSVDQLIADTLHCDIGRSRPLAELLFNKTAGNPFFLTQILNSLYQEQLLFYNTNTGCWQWDVQKIQTMSITDNVVDLMIDKIQKLPQDTQNVLKLAACIGNTFDLHLLSIVNQKSPSVTNAELWNAIEENFVLPLNDNYKILLFNESDSETTEAGQELEVSYKFLHDRVQQAAYTLISEQNRNQLHLRIGQLLLKNTPSEELEECIFDIVNQLNMGSELIGNRTEKHQLAQLNLIAAQRAKASTAYETSARYLVTGLDLLEPDSWQNEYDLTLALHVEAVEVKYLNANFERAKFLSAIVLEHAKTLIEKMRVYENQINFYISQNQMLEAISTALPILELLGEPLSDEIPQDLAIEDLLNLPEMTDPCKLAAMRILMSMSTPAYIAAPEMFAPVIFSMVNLCIKYGNSLMATYAYVTYGLLLCGAKDDIESGYRFGQLAVKLLEQLDAKAFHSKVVMFFNVGIKHWKDPLRETIHPFLESLQSGLEVGDMEYAGYSAMDYGVHQFLAGENLEVVSQEQVKYLALLKEMKQNYHITIFSIWRQLVLNLLNEKSEKTDHCRLMGEGFNEAQTLPLLKQENNVTTLFTVYFIKAMLCYLFGDYHRALENIEQAEQFVGGVVGFMQSAQHNFYSSLILLASCTNSPADRQAHYLSKVDANQTKLKHWATHAPANYQHKYELVEAEKARVLGQPLAAMEYYDRAIQFAKEQEYTHEAAIANERAAEFYLNCGRRSIAQLYFTEAYYSYLRWGATAKVKQLEAAYPQLTLKRTAEASEEIVSTSLSTSSGNANSLDLLTIIKASQALAGEIVLSKLLFRLLKILMESAGAQTSCLALEKDGQLVIEATGSVDQEDVVLCPSIRVDHRQPLPVSVINFVARTQESVVLSNATKEGKFTSDPYIVRTQPKSVLCAPIINQGKLIGLIYLENNLTTGAFTADRLEILRLLSSQAAISLENALLYANLESATENLKRANTQLEEYSQTLEQRVEERTQELKTQTIQLEKTLYELKQTQIQLIQNEKMSSLGQLVAGIAHEINNPVNFIHGNLTHAREYCQSLLQLIDCYQQQYPQPTVRILQEIEKVDLEFIHQDLPKLLNSMQIGAERIRQIVLSLRNFSRLDEAEVKPVNIHDGIDNTLVILQNRLKEKTDSSSIQVIKEYGKLPEVECYAGQLNQVFMNVISNAIDVLKEQHPTAAQPEVSTIWIRTEAIDSDHIRIRIADNGLGMPTEVLERIFDPFFTTKPVGSGTGLGLSISYQIVTEKHSGKMTCVSSPGKGTEFVIEIPVQQSNVLVK
jgi:predicted ATPase/signal transduction histidine kinase